MAASKGRPDAAALKATAAGRWLEILAAAGISAELLDGKGHPCPRCGGDDRFAAMPDVAQRGAVLCRACFAKGGGDGIATLQWILGIDFPAAVRWLGEHLNVGPGHRQHAAAPVEACLGGATDSLGGNRWGIGHLEEPRGAPGAKAYSGMATGGVR